MYLWSKTHMVSIIYDAYVHQSQLSPVINYKTLKIIKLLS